MLQSTQSRAVAKPLQEHHIGKIDFIELVTPDSAVTEKFYSQLFGWTFRSLSCESMDYALATLNGQRVAGLIREGALQIQLRQPMWLGLFAVNDVDATRNEAVEHGGRVLFEPRTLPGWAARPCLRILKVPRSGFSLPAAASRPTFLLHRGN